jgi:HSP20 family protein
MPLVNVKDEDKYVTVTAEVPGMDKKDIEIQANGSMLTLRGERKAEKEEKGGNGHGWWRKESSYGAFTRRVTLPCDVDASKTEATMANGVLTIRLAKAESAKATSIAIK